MNDRTQEEILSGEKKRHGKENEMQAKKMQSCKTVADAELQHNKGNVIFTP